MRTRSRSTLRQEREFTISDGTHRAGLADPRPGAAGPGPLLLDVHGGPHNAWNGAADPAHLYHQVLAARGWTVLSSTRGRATATARRSTPPTIGAWGVADAKDFLEPLDALVAEGIADPARLAVTGYSYGGYMTCYLTSRDGRFAAAVAGGCGQRPDQHGGHLRRRARAVGLGVGLGLAPLAGTSRRATRSPGSPT